MFSSHGGFLTKQRLKYLLKLFAKIKFLGNFPNLRYLFWLLYFNCFCVYMSVYLFVCVLRFFFSWRHELVCDLWLGQTGQTDELFGALFFLTKHNQEIWNNLKLFLRKHTINIICTYHESCN